MDVSDGVGDTLDPVDAVADADDVCVLLGVPEREGVGTELGVIDTVDVAVRVGVPFDEAVTDAVVIWDRVWDALGVRDGSAVTLWLGLIVGDSDGVSDIEGDAELDLVSACVVDGD